MAKPTKYVRPSRITIPDHAHPLTRIIFSEMKRQGVTYLEMELTAGVLVSTLKSWRQANRPGIETVEACLGALNWDLVAVPRPQHLPPELVAELGGLAERWGQQLAALHPILIATAARSYEALPLTQAGASRRPELQSIAA